LAAVDSSGDQHQTDMMSVRRTLKRSAEYIISAFDTSEKRRRVFEELMERVERIQHELAELHTVVRPEQLVIADWDGASLLTC